MANARYARHMAIVEQLRSRQWVSSTSLATRFGVSTRTIYRDIEQLISYGLPIDAATGRDGGYSLNSESPFEPLTLDSDDALRLYVLGLKDPGNERPHTAHGRGELATDEVGAYSRDMLAKLSQRIYFDTRDWYWQDEGSGHVPAIRYSLMTCTALSLIARNKHSTDLTEMIVKPYGPGRLRSGSVCL